MSERRLVLTICRKIQGKAEEGNTCLQTPGTCESCPLWHQKRRVKAFVADHDQCESCRKNKAKRRGKSPAPIALLLGKEHLSLCMACAKKASSALDGAIAKIESKYERREQPNGK
jgi:hypothetical protein